MEGIDRIKAHKAEMKANEDAEEAKRDAERDAEVKRKHLEADRIMSHDWQPMWGYSNATRTCPAKAGGKCTKAEVEKHNRKREGRCQAKKDGDEPRVCTYVDWKCVDADGVSTGPCSGHSIRRECKAASAADECRWDGEEQDAWKVTGSPKVITFNDR